jgi:hypothetical protein
LDEGRAVEICIITVGETTVLLDRKAGDRRFEKINCYFKPFKAHNNDGAKKLRSRELWRMEKNDATIKVVKIHITLCILS